MKTDVKPRAVQHLNFDMADDRKPSKSYVELVVEVLRDSYSGEMHPSEIYHALEIKYSYYRNMSPRSKKSWMSSIRHALLHQAFKSRPGDASSRKRGKVWSLNENFDEHQKAQQAKSPSGQTHSKKRKSVPLQEVPMPQTIDANSQGFETNQGNSNQVYTDYGLYAQQYNHPAYSPVISPYHAAAYAANTVGNLAHNTYIPHGNPSTTLAVGSYYSGENGAPVPVRSYVTPGPVQNAVRFLPPPGGMTVAPILSPPAVTSSFLSGGMLVSSRSSPVYGPVPVIDPTAAGKALQVVSQNATSHVTQQESTQQNQNGSTQPRFDYEKRTATQQEGHAYSDPEVAKTVTAADVTGQNFGTSTCTNEQRQNVSNTAQQASVTTPKGNHSSSNLVNQTSENQAVHAPPALVQIHHYSPNDVQKQSVTLPPAPENCACCVMYYTPPKKARTDERYDSIQQQCDGPESQLKTEHAMDSSSSALKDDLHRIIRKSLDISSNEGGGGWVNEWTSFMTSSMMGAMGQCAAKVENVDDTNPANIESQE